MDNGNKIDSFFGFQSLVASFNVVAAQNLAYKNTYTIQGARDFS